MFVVGICDENLYMCKKIENCIVSVLFDECDCVTKTYDDLGVMLNDVIQGTEAFDFIFVPIACNDDSGLKFASVIRDKNINTEIVFTSYNLKNVLDGYTYRAFDYLVLPIAPTRLKNMFNRYFSSNDKSGNFFYLKTFNKIDRFDKFSIYYFSSDGRKITMYTNGNPLTFYSKLDEVEEQVSIGVQNFVRVHQSYLVNVQFIKTLTRDNIVIDNGDYIPVSRKYQSLVHDKFLAYLEGNI
ncbi:MAG: LytR/AlgR family response regulator transcription factor [Eubacterium sp.]